VTGPLSFRLPLHAAVLMHRHPGFPCGAAPGTRPSPAVRAVCSLGSFGGWVSHLPERLAHLAQQYAWPGGTATVLVLLALAAAWRAARLAALRRAVAGGWQARVIPPRVLDPSQASQVWDLLAALAQRAAHGWRFASAPVAFEIRAHQGGLAAGLWLPAHVPVPAVADIAAQAWPGARVEAAGLPGTATGLGAVVAGYRLAASVPEARWLVRPELLTRSRRGAGAGGEGAEPLRSVLSGLASAGVPAVLQVLVRPAPGRRIAALRYAARHGGTPARSPALGWVRGVLDLVQPGPARAPAAGGSRAADPVAAAAARQAAEKTAARPELLAAIRVGASGPRRPAAAGAARQIADGYVLASRYLHPVRLRRAAAVLSGRRATRGEWLLMSAAELGVLAHLPADPARYRFTTAALHRLHPHTAYLADPEPPAAGISGWTRRGGTGPGDRAAAPGGHGPRNVTGPRKPARPGEDSSRKRRPHPGLDAGSGEPDSGERGWRR
jgi:hypothetical protein